MLGMPAVVAARIAVAAADCNPGTLVAAGDILAVVHIRNLVADSRIPVVDKAAGNPVGMVVGNNLAAVGCNGPVAGKMSLLPKREQIQRRQH